MLYFDYDTAEHQIIKECLQYLPNPNDVQDTVYKIHFVIKPPLAIHPSDDLETPDKERVYTALFTITYEETGSKSWEFDSLENDLTTELNWPSPVIS